MKSIYLLSGLGADKRAFKHLIIPDFEMVFIEWIPPLPKESMAHYAKRISSQIKDKHPILLGLSFGGIIALELAKIIDSSCVFLISSAKRKEELHPCFSIAMRWQLIDMIPKSFLTKSNFILEFLFGINTKQHKELLADIIADTDIDFLLWALKSMFRWDNNFVPVNLIEIHGTADRLIPYRKGIDRSTTINGGGHLMILNNADEIQKIILVHLRKYQL